MAGAFSFAGIAFTTAAVYFLWIAFGMSTAADVPGYGGVANLQALQLQIANLMIGLAGELSAVICFATAAVISRRTPSP